MRSQDFARLGAALLFAGLVLLLVVRIWQDGDVTLPALAPEPPSVTPKADPLGAPTEGPGDEEGAPTSPGADLWILEMESGRGPGGRPRPSEAARPAESLARGGVVEAAGWTLPEGRGSLTLVVQGASGLPVPEAAVSLRWLDDEGLTGDAVTDAGGEARFVGLAAGRYTYRVRAPDRPELVSAAPIQLDEGERKRLTVRVSGAVLSISGRVSDRAGEPLPGIEIEVVRHRFASLVEEAVTAPAPVPSAGLSSSPYLVSAQSTDVRFSPK